jgi:hypothetical protein
MKPEIVAITIRVMKPEIVAITLGVMNPGVRCPRVP